MSENDLAEIQACERVLLWCAAWDGGPRGALRGLAAMVESSGLFAVVAVGVRGADGVLACGASWAEVAADLPPVVSPAARRGRRAA